MQLIASFTSPFARKIHVQLIEKEISFEFHEDAPWDAKPFLERKAFVDTAPPR